MKTEICSDFFSFWLCLSMFEQPYLSTQSRHQAEKPNNKTITITSMINTVKINYFEVIFLCSKCYF